MKMTKQPRPIVVFVLTMVVFVGILFAVGWADEMRLRQSSPIEIEPGLALIHTDAGWRLLGFDWWVLGGPHRWFAATVITPLREILFFIFTLGLILTIRAEFYAWRHRRFDRRQALLEQNPDF